MTIDLEGFVYYSNQADTVESLFKVFEEAMSSLGFDRILLALMTNHPSLKKEAEHGIVKNYPESWVSYYLEKKYDEIDPVRLWSFTRTGVYTWNEIIESGSLSKQQIQMFKEAEESGLYNGLGVALRGSGGAVAALGAASTDRHIDKSPFVLDKVNLMANQFYICFWRLMESRHTLSTVTLTSRECDILKWAAKGLTKTDIGARLNISHHTVDYHVRNILRKLDARNMVAAIFVALNLGLIQI
ncbi:MAG TPA: LuxR family transcriptional regulator [Gammaproteobacteria bacterium]|nr:LuxR family transcriptional regulator [Gammaproteobacteria bacterium]